MIAAFTVSCQRQKYLRAALESWARVRGIGECRLLFALEPAGHQFPVRDFCGYLERVFPGRWAVAESEVPLRCLRNTRRAVSLALQQEDFAVLAEEDLEVADDILEYFAWARGAYRQDKDVKAVCAHARASRSADPAAVARAAWFNPLAWGTWRDRWEDFIDPGWGAEEGSGNAESWDLRLMNRMRASGACSIFPLRSRSVHRGELSTQYRPDLSHLFWPPSVSDCYAPHYPPQPYREVEFPAEPGVLVV